MGTALCKRLIREGRPVRGTFVSSKAHNSISTGIEPVGMDPIGPATDWTHALKGVDTVIHLAARVHVLHETSLDPLGEFRSVNTEGTRRLAEQAAAAGVRKFIFMSTVGVNGDNSGPKPYTENSEPHAHNPYSISKYEAELLLRGISSKSGMEVVVVRAPLVYGPGNPGNFLSLLRIVYRGYPLPLLSVDNRRSLLYIGNLIDVLITVLTHTASAGQTYLVSDGADVSVPELIRRLAAALSVPARLFPMPAQAIRFFGALSGKRSLVNSLTNSLIVDISKIHHELNWTPPYTLNDGLRETTDWFKKEVLR